ncbi:MAG: hypothetical protein RIR26_1042 [Pseudomonadota bacterium]|jgi:hypothetical protein
MLRNNGPSTAQNKRAFSWALAGVLLALWPAQHGCTRSAPKKSNLRDLAGDAAGTASALKEMTLKYSFVFIGTGGKRYPVYMSADLKVSETAPEAVWNSRIDSDGGLVSAIDESKTIKPDTQLALKMVRPAAPDNVETWIFTSGNPELGRGLSLKVQKVNAGGQQAWKATELTYFGTTAHIEDSFAPAVAAAAPAIKN